MTFKWFVAVLLLAVSCAGNADESETLYNVFSLSSAASAEVDNDLMTATLVVRKEDKDPAILAEKVNSTMNWAVNVLRPYATLKTKTRDYQTHPRYDSSQSRRLIGWRASQTMQIETDDFEAAGKAIQALQQKLQVQGIRLSAKPETRAAASDALINEALTSFKDRARLVQRNMGATEFKVLNVDIQTEQGAVARYESDGYMTEMVRSAAMAEPAIEAGTSRVSVQVRGRIQLD